MHLLLLALGALVTAVGAVMLAFSVPLVDPAGVALFTSGAIAVVGGLILIGLSAVVRSLSSIAERLDIQPMAVPPVVSIAHDVPPPRPIRAASEASAVALSTASETPTSPESPRPGDAPKLSEAAPAKAPPRGWFRRVKSPAASEPGSEAELPRTGPAPEYEARDRAANDPDADFALLARLPEPLQAPDPPPPFVSPPPIRPASRAPAPAQKTSGPPNGTAATTVYRSGVIDGMAYSLFMDGSIEAELPTGRVRFATIDELQKYLVSRR